MAILSESTLTIYISRSQSQSLVYFSSLKTLSHPLDMFRQIARRSTQHLGQRAQSQTASIGRRYAHAPVAFDWRDPLGANNLFTEDELAIAETAEQYCQERMLPRVLGTNSSDPHDGNTAN